MKSGNKERKISSPINKALQGFSVIIFSVLIFCFYIHKNLDLVYAADDNIMQWGPVIRKVFDRIFAGEGIPYWDFYQYKGFDIFSSGYYGQLNPFMYLAYAVSRYIFSYKVETLTVYMIMMFSLGNLMMYTILTDFGIKLPTKIISVLAYSISVIFFMYAFYYFTFNNYFFISFLLWIIIHTRNSQLQWAVPGIILAFSLLLGHVQYSCYYVMLYCIIEVVFCVQDKKPKRLLSMFTSILIFAALSCFIMLLSLSVAGNRDLAAEDKVDLSFFINYIQPIALLQPICGLVFKTKSLERLELQHNIGLGIFGIVNLLFFYNPIKNMTTATVSFVKSNKKNTEKSEENNPNIVENISPTIQTTLKFGMIFLFVLFSVFYIAKFIELNTGMLLFIIVYGGIAAVALIIAGVIAYRRRDNILPKLVRITNTPDNFKGVIIAFFIVINLCICNQNIFSLVYGVLIAYYVYICIKKDASEKFTFAEKTVHAFLFGAVFFVIFGSGENIVSIILYQIPVINKFRYLYKCAFIYIPVLIFTGAFMIDRLPLNKNMYKTVISISVLVSIISGAGIVNTYNTGIHTYINNKDFSYIDYRVIESEVKSRIEELDIDKNYRFMMIGGEIESSSDVCTYAFTKNYGAVYSIFTLNGYDSTFSMKNFEQSNMLMNDVYYEGQMSNLVRDTNRFKEYQDSEESVKLFEKQMIDNGVKYILYYEYDKTIENFVSLIEKCPELDIVRTENWFDRLSLIEISGVKSVCSYGDNIEIPVSPEIDAIEFDTEFSEPTEVTISETYEPHYKLYLTESNGAVSEAEVTENADGYVTAIIPSGIYTVKLCYENSTMDKAVIMACVCFVLTIISVVAVCINKNKRRCR